MGIRKWQEPSPSHTSTGLRVTYIKLAVVGYIDSTTSSSSEQSQRYVEEVEISDSKRKAALELKR